MYQSIDDIEDDGGADNSESVRRSKIFIGLLIGLAVLIAVGMFSNHRKIDTDPRAAEMTEQYNVYAKALAEPHPALRRARLLDFVQSYPDHDRRLAAEAQLDVIQQADDQDWLSLQEIIFDPAQSPPVKLAALDLYEEMWGSVLLGGREDEVLDLREQLSSEPEAMAAIEVEVQDFTPQPDKFDDKIDNTQLAGGLVVVERAYIPPTPIVRAPPPTAMRQPVITKPRVRKDRKPRYPSRALRRGVEAEVILALSIDDDGEVQMTEVVSVRTARKYRKDFIKAAERAALRTKYYPKQIDGNPVATSGILKKYIFDIQD